MPFPIPQHVTDYIRAVFAEGNRRVSSQLSQLPTVHEPFLDQNLLEFLRCNPAAKALSGNWIVRIDSHFVGGGRHWGRWEIADIGVLVFFRRNGQIERTKLALLQSKRLYPNEVGVADEALDYGIGPLLRRLQIETNLSKAVQSRSFTFTDESEYEAIKSGGDQIGRIDEFEEDRGVPVHYMLYNPLTIPDTITFPSDSGQEADAECDIGTRIIPARVLHSFLANLSKNQSPSFGKLKIDLPSPFDTLPNLSGWRLEHFIADLVVGCQEGYFTDDPEDETLGRVASVYVRGAPIWAAIAVTIDAGEGAL